MRSKKLECDIAIIGGSFGGVAAALAACEARANVILTETTEWIGGQVTSQLVSALDEHPLIEKFGGTRSYYRFRDGVRRYYQEQFSRQGSRIGSFQNPGGGWVSALCFEPRVGLQVINEMLIPFVESGALQLLTGYHPITAIVSGTRVMEVTLANRDGRTVSIRANYFLDATELGDLLPLAGVPYASGAEAIEDTGEEHACTDGPHPERVQAFTSCFILEHRLGENHTIPKPSNYEYWRKAQPFRLDVPAEAGGTPIHYPVFTPDYQGQRTFWTYRRILDAGQLAPGKDFHDLALINWDSIDYSQGNLIDATPEQQSCFIEEAKDLSRSFLYWLQTEVPRDDGQGFGYPGLCLSSKASGTKDGFAMFPYIRESRRILGLERVKEQDIVRHIEDPVLATNARARSFPDSVGIGWYPLDIHACHGGVQIETRFKPSLPYQIPLGALITPALTNLLAAAKNLSVTHITNGAYRLHPAEWNIGESAGSLAAFCLSEDCTPVMVHSQEKLRHHYQKRLLERGVSLAWATDVPHSSQDFVATQKCLLAGPFPPLTPRYRRTEILPAEPITYGEAATLLQAFPSANENLPGNILDSWAVQPTTPLPGSILKDALSLLALPTQGISEYPSYIELARILDPIL